MITVIVGPENARFYVHRDVLSKATGIQAPAADSSTKLIKADTPLLAISTKHPSQHASNSAPRPAPKIAHLDSIRLENDEPDIVHRVIGFMYRSGPRLFPEPSPADFGAVLGLVKIYLLAVRFDIPALQFKANREIINHLDYIHDFFLDDMDDDSFVADLEKQMQAIRLAYAGTTSTYDALRMTLVSHMAMHWDSYRGKLGMAVATDGSESELSKFMGEAPAFAKDLLRQLRPAVAGIRVPKSVKKRKRLDSTRSLG